jgi:acetate kinase
VAQRFALPRALHEDGIRRYGFHGLSYEYVARRLREIDPLAAAGRVVVAHLGAGASLCALRDGRSVETTMSFTPLDGLPMATRCGALDPGVLLHLLAQPGISAARLSHLLYHESGLLGVSGASGDLRALRAADTPAAREAIALFVYQLRRELGALVAVLGGLDVLVFTAGIGENDAPMRAAVCDDARWLGVALDPAANAAHATRISSNDSAIKVFVVPTDEEAMIAIHTMAVLA